MKVLVAYATRHGATRGIAQRIGQRLESHGLVVEVRPVREVRGMAVADCDAFVIGAAAYFFHWMDETTTFVRRHAPLLASRPVWLFSSGPLGTDATDPQGRDQRETAEPKEFADLAALIHPRGRSIFFGAYDPAQPPVGFMERLTRMLPAARDGLPAGDFRDWAEIDAWADGIATELLEPAARSH